MFKHIVNGTNSDRVNWASSACVARPDGSPVGWIEINEGYCLGLEPLERGEIKKRTNNRFITLSLT